MFENLPLGDGFSLLQYTQKAAALLPNSKSLRGKNEREPNPAASVLLFQQCTAVCGNQ